MAKRIKTIKNTDEVSKALNINDIKYIFEKSPKGTYPPVLESTIYGEQRIVHKYHINRPLELVRFYERYKKYPSLCAFAALIGVSEKTITVWKKKYPEFKEATEMCESMQKSWLFEKWSETRCGEGFAKFMLINLHKMSDKVEQDMHFEIVNKSELTEDE